MDWCDTVDCGELWDTLSSEYCFKAELGKACIKCVLVVLQVGIFQNIPPLNAIIMLFVYVGGALTERRQKKKKINRLLIDLLIEVLLLFH